jgi:hypothetical protein
MKKIETQIIIHSRPDLVWSVLTDFEKFCDWNPFLKTVSGEKQIGAQLKVEIQPPNAKSMTFKPTILILEKPKHFRWLGKLFVRGIFDGEHYFKLNDNGDGSTLFIHGEIFTGILVNLFSQTLENTERGFELMNMALKKECEK